GRPGSAHSGPGRPDSAAVGHPASGGAPGRPVSGSGSRATGDQATGSQAGGPAGRAGAGSPDASHRSTATAAADQAGEEDWPEPARPGGPASAAGTASAASTGDG
ncbi:DNA polymerase III subunit gamma and tau, partial [Micromonospora aurantiaca]|nr:DNA polymerase III subunit gamma and tau [Micromonospora aurantiaca]